MKHITVHFPHGGFGRFSTTSVVAEATRRWPSIARFRALDLSLAPEGAAELDALFARRGAVADHDGRRQPRMGAAELANRLAALRGCAQYEACVPWTEREAMAADLRAFLHGRGGAEPPAPEMWSARPLDAACAALGWSHAALGWSYDAVVAADGMGLGTALVAVRRWTSRAGHTGERAALLIGGATEAEATRAAVAAAVASESPPGSAPRGAGALSEAPEAASLLA